MRVSLDSLTFRRRIGAGAGGFTYAAEYRGGQVAVRTNPKPKPKPKPKPNPNHNQVAVKMASGGMG